jgi:4-alpha-glucanotransferase
VQSAASLEGGHWVHLPYQRVASRLAADWGIAPGYFDLEGRWVEPKDEAVARVLAAMGADRGSPPAGGAWVLRPGAPLPEPGPFEIVTEDGATLWAEATLPPALGPGYHTLARPGGPGRRLIVSPGRCYLPSDLHAWGWAAQLYAVRSSASWGIGDLADLRRLTEWARDQGAGAVLLNPLAAPPFVAPQEASPYFPSSRRFRNPLYLRIEEVPGAERLGHRLEPLAAAGRALNQDRRIDRDRVFDLKVWALEELFAAFGDDPDFERFRLRTEGLAEYAVFCALTEVFGSRCRTWPEEYRHPARPAVTRFARERRRRVAFHAWMQWLLERQLAAVEALPLILDLPIGVQPDGADAWAWQDVYAAGVSVGAPPDPFNPAGQDWSVPPLDPWRLKAAGYDPLVQVLRATLRHAGGIRIDHVMGLFRLYWIPEGADPDHGVYVRYPHRELLDIVALESQRARAFVIGEDLGTVEAGVREEMAERRMLSTRVFWFEDRPPAEYPAEAVAALTTHDLPTLAGVWEGSDSDPSLVERLRRHACVRDGTATAVVARAAYGALARSPCRLVAATLEDAVGAAERPNRPGTTDRANWSLALPLELDRLAADPAVLALAATLREGRDDSLGRSKEAT